MLTQKEIEQADELLAIAGKEWNEIADEFNQWCDTCVIEKLAFVLQRMRKEALKGQQ